MGRRPTRECMLSSLSGGSSLLLGGRDKPFVCPSRGRNSSVFLHPPGGEFKPFLPSPGGDRGSVYLSLPGRQRQTFISPGGGILRFFLHPPGERHSNVFPSPGGTEAAFICPSRGRDRGRRLSPPGGGIEDDCTFSPGRGMIGLYLSPEGRREKWKYSSPGRD